MQLLLTEKSLKRSGCGTYSSKYSIGLNGIESLGDSRKRPHGVQQLMVSGKFQSRASLDILYMNEKTD